MKKNKLIALGAATVLSATAVVGGTLAYFTDKDAETNVFTTGDVKIDLIEDFEQDSKLIPGIDVKKEVTVENKGSEDAYVRVHIAIPSMLDRGSEDEPGDAAYNNTLHFNFGKDSVENGQWNWNADKDDSNYPGNGGNWNCYQTTVDGVAYNVYVITYETALASNETTATAAMEKVYLDTKVTNEDMAEILEALGQIKILVAAEGGQAAGFDNAYDALNTQFGVPGEYDVTWISVAEAAE